MSAAIQHDGRADRAGLAKRHGILRAARELFATSGYDETTIAAIAQAAGVAVGTVYRYFANKHEILMDVYLAFNAEITQVLQSSAILELPPQQAPRVIVEAVFRRARAHRRFMASYQVEAHSPAEVARLRGGTQETAAALDAYFQGLVSCGHVSPFATSRYAEHVNNLVGAAVKHCFVFEHGEREAFYREGVIAVIERLFFGPPLRGGESGGHDLDGAPVGPVGPVGPAGA